MISQNFLPAINNSWQLLIKIYGTTYGIGTRHSPDILRWYHKTIAASYSNYSCQL
jgi:hypothetical protein